MKQKVNDYCEFPIDLDMYPYTKEGLSKADNPSPDEETEHINKNLYKYKLRGVVVHSGVAEGGHYYSYIQD